MTVPARRLLAGATLVALVATLGSLWFSLGMGLFPCELCWYQRILMYPLVVVLGVATLDEYPEVYRTVLPLAALGVLVSGYHTYLQATLTECGFGAGGCSAVQYQLPVLGLSIPNMALLAFLLITGAMVVLARSGVIRPPQTP
jgi:disulfide bond formation protein DsbB